MEFETMRELARRSGVKVIHQDMQGNLAGRRWGYEVLLPVSQIKAALRVGVREIDSIAELYKVTPEYVKEALEYYIFSGHLKKGGNADERNIG